MKYAFLLFCTLNSIVALAQTDSLEKSLATAKGDQRVKALNELFRSNFNSEPVKAIGFARQALTLATEIDDRKGMAAAYNNLGVAYKSQGALDKSLEYYLRALSIYDNIKNKDGIATTKSNIGTIYSIKKDYGQAMKYFEEANASFTELGEQDKIIGSMNNLGILHSDLQLFEEALKYFSQASQLSEKIGKVTADPLNNIGNLYFRQGNYQRAADYYEQAMVLARKDNDQNTLLYTLANLGELYAKAGQTGKAQAYLDSASALSEKLQAYVFQPTILKSQAINFAKQNKMKEAYETMLRYDQAKEKIYGEESTRKIAQMEMALDLQEKEKEIENLKATDEIKSLQLKSSRMFIIVTVLGIIILIGLVNFVYTKKKLPRIRR
ncbi:MAG: tetratricopeptide repeat protein [Bacteroidota bacterium]|jgi:tetratricopeptide (TPR) repeat protein|nr:tetratricopeptide repeat protein [Cytophagales bacterium]MCE2957472.1 tetratricopeptide repeat protein [Flammeovirgaceae bacterium]MCZ8071609.1 tetratricopeptide repeat protein [Cytophagales bacterium]